MDKHIVNIDVEYLGDLHCRVKHGPSGQEFLTDAPVDNQGKGEYFSPTDLLATASGSCIATIMGIIAKNHNINIDGLKIKVQKEMQDQPFRCVKKLKLDFTFPHKLNEHDFRLIAAAVQKCPVTRSLSSEVEFETTFEFPE